mgnify:CR=1 FL=1
MYAEWGGAPAAGVVTGVGTVSGRLGACVASMSASRMNEWRVA